MSRASDQIARRIRTEALRDFISGNGDIGSAHHLLRMFVLALMGRHIAIGGTDGTYETFDDLARELVAPDGMIRMGKETWEIEIVARVALGRLVKLSPGDPAGEWLWTASGAPSPRYDRAELLGAMTADELRPLEKRHGFAGVALAGQMPGWVPEVARSAFPPPPGSDEPEELTGTVA